VRFAGAGNPASLDANGIGAAMNEFLHGASAFFGYFGGAVAFCIAFGAIYLRLTPHREFELIVREHNRRPPSRCRARFWVSPVAAAAGVRRPH
jgi:hypothetical protein